MMTEGDDEMPGQSTENLPLQTQSARDHVPPAVTYVPSDFVCACLIVILIGAGLWPSFHAAELQCRPIQNNQFNLASA